MLQVQYKFFYWCTYFKSAPDFENPSDNGTNNSYEVKVRATDSAGNNSDQTLTVKVST